MRIKIKHWTIDTQYGWGFLWTPKNRIRLDNVTHLSRHDGVDVLFKRTFYTLRGLIFCAMTIWYANERVSQRRRMVRYGLPPEMAMQFGAIAFSATYPASPPVVTPANPINITATVSGSNPLLVTTSGNYDGNSDSYCSGMTWNSVAGARAIFANDTGSYTWSEIWYKAAPAAGSYTMALTGNSLASYCNVGVMIYTGADQTANVKDSHTGTDFGNKANKSVAISAVDADVTAGSPGMAVSVCGAWNDITAGSATQRWDDSGSAFYGRAQDESGVSGATTHTFTHASQNGSACIALFKSGAAATALPKIMWW